MRALVPKGYFIDRFPTESATAADIQAREVESSRKVLQDQVAALETQAQALINKRMNFFAPHFGLKPQKGIADTYLLDEQGNWKGVTTGAAANSIANEIMLYKNPAPSSVNLTQVEMVGLIMNMIKRYELSVQVSQLAAAMTTEDVRVFLGFDKRPTYSQYTTTTKLIQTAGSKLSNVTISELLDPDNSWLSVLPGLKPTNTDKSDYKGTWAYKSVRNHPSGFKAHLIEIAKFYERAFKTGKPQSYWQLFSQYRIGIFTSPELNGRKGVALYRVDPFTGAPNKTISQEDIIATGAGTDADGTLLSQVRAALFPEMYTLEAGVNYQVGDAKVRYRNELQTALNMWNGVSDKLNTPLVTIASQSDDGSVTNLSVYLQPTGIEAAMAKLVKGDPFQAWFDSILGTKTQVANDLPKKMVTSQISDNEWNNYTAKFGNMIQLLHVVLTHPSTFVTGIHHIAKVYGKAWKLESDIESILSSVEWPSGRPVKLFEVYVNDTRDANIVMNTLFTYLEEESLMKPPEMYFAEGIHAKLDYAQYVAPKNPNVQSTDQAPEMGKTYNYEVVKKQHWTIHPTWYKRIELFRRDVASIESLPQLRRYFTTGKTVISKNTVTGPGSGFLKEATQLIEVENRMTPMSVQMGSMEQEEFNLLIGVGTVALIGGILLFKR